MVQDGGQDLVGIQLAGPCATLRDPDGALDDIAPVPLDRRRPHADLAAIDEITAILLADPQTSGGLLVAGEVEGGVVIGELVDASASPLLSCR